MKVISNTNMNTIKLSLPISLDLDSSDITNDDEPFALNRNSWLFKNKLSPLYKITNSGYPSTKNKAISYSNNVIKVGKTDFNVDATKVISKITTIDEQSGDLIDRSIKYTVYYKDNKAYIYYNDGSGFTSVFCNDKDSIALYKNKIAVLYNSTVTVYSDGLVYKTIKDWSYDRLNTFVYVNDNLYAFGYDNNDCRKCYTVAYVNGEQHTLEYQGCLSVKDNQIIVTGEPVYRRCAVDENSWRGGNGPSFRTFIKENGAKLANHTEMDNGTIKWSLANYKYLANSYTVPTSKVITTYDELQELTSSVNNNILKLSNTDYAKMGYNTHSYDTVWISAYTVIDETGIDYPDIETCYVDGLKCYYNDDYYVGGKADYWIKDNKNLFLIDPNATPGNFWSTAGDYETAYPFNGVFTNIQTDRGKIYDWGKGWTRHYCQSVESVWSQICKEKNQDITYNTNAIKYAPLLFIENNNVLMHLDTYTSSSNMFINDVTGENSYYRWEDDITGGGYYEIKSTDYEGNIAFLTSATTTGGYREAINRRYRIIGYDEYQSHEYDDWVHLIGDSNSGDKGLVDTFPLVRTLNDHIAVNIYNGVFTSVLYDGVLLNTSTDDGIKYFDYEDDKILIDDKIIEIEDISDDNVYFKKIAEYLTTSNIITPKIIVENRTNEKVYLSNAYISQMGVSFNDTYSLAGFYSPTSISNNNVLYAQGVNENMNDADKRSASYLFPEYTIPNYTHSSQLNKLAQYKKENNVFISPVIEDTNNQVDVYYTYTLDSLDNSYKYSIKDDETFVDEKLNDNTWYIDGETFYYPIGLVDALLINNENSTPYINVGDYAVELYEKDGYKTLMINPVNQELSIEAIFTIYSSTYFFNGQSIYYRNNDTDTFVTDALGLEFLANSGTEAWFYSPADKNIYVFTGSTTITKLKSAAKINKIIDTVYSPSEQALYILTDIGLFRKADKEESLIEVEGDSLVKVEDGVIILNNNNFIQYKPWEITDGEKQILKYSTPWIGNYDKIYSFQYLDIITDGAGNLKVSMDVLYDNESCSKFDLKSTTDFRFRITPKDIKGHAFRFNIESDTGIKGIILGSSIISDDIKGTRV